MWWQWWQAILWAAAIGIAFCLWDSISRANSELEATQRVVVALKRRSGAR